MADIKVSILCLAYNQKAFIREAIDSFLMQETDFAFEILINDDASTDGTKEIIEEYQKKYPDIIKPVFQKTNQYSKGKRNFMLRYLMPKARGEYFALCEGDDYWTDPTKLQKQVDFMENNPNHSLVFHPVEKFYEDKGSDSSVIPEKRKKPSISDLLRDNVIPTCSVLYRARGLSEYEELNLDVSPGDWYLHIFHAQFGSIGFINKVMARYRKHSGGVWWNSYANPVSLIEDSAAGKAALFKEMINMYGDDGGYRAIIEGNIHEVIRNTQLIQKAKREKLLKSIASKNPGIIYSYIRQVELDNKRLYEAESALEDRVNHCSREIREIKDSRTWRVVSAVAKVINNRYILKIRRIFTTPIRVPGLILGRYYDWGASRRYKNAWVISDRPDESSDNGILLYEYITNNHKDINTYFVLSRESDDYSRLSKDKIRLIPYKSGEHKKLMKYSTLEVSAFFNFSPFSEHELGRKKPLKKAFILHGMDQSDLSVPYKNMGLDLYCATTKESYDFYKQGKSMDDVSDKNFILSGMPRYDLVRSLRKNIKQKNRSKIVIAPTWRRFLKFKPWTAESVSMDEVLGSDYLRYYRQILGSNEIRDLSKKYDIIFIPHPEMKDFLGHLEVPSFISVKTYSEMKTKGLYDLALDTELIISDYSSTVFDFAFLGSKVTYFNFDEDLYYSDEHGVFKSWFDIDRDGFGPSFKSVDSLKRYLATEKWVRYQENIDKVWGAVPSDSCKIITLSLKELCEH